MSERSASIFDSPVPALPDRVSFQRTLRRGSAGLTLALGLPALALLGLVLFLLHSAERVGRTDRMVARAHVVEKLLVDMETGLRGYQLSGEQRFLEPLVRGRERLGPALPELAAMAREEGAREAIAKLSGAITAWQAYVEEALALPRAAAAEPAFVSRGKDQMDEVRARTEALILHEESLRDRRDATLRQVVVALFSLLGLLMVAGIPALVLWLRRLLRTTGEDYEASLLNAERRAEELRVSLGSIGDAVLATNHRGEVAFLNPEAERLTGWSDAEAHGRPLLEVFSIHNEQTGGLAENPVERVLREKRVVGLANHTVLRARGGKEYPIEDSAAPIFHADGSVRGAILVFHDVTEQYARDRALRQAEWLSRTALEVADAGAYGWEVAADRVTADVNTGRLFEIDPAQREQGLPLSAYLKAIAPEDLPSVQARIAQSVQTGADFQTAYRVRSTDGKERWLDARGRVEKDAAGQVLRLVGFVQDTTERRAAEAALARLAAESDQQRRLYETILSNTPDFVYVFNLEHQFTYVNAALLAMWGRTWEDSIGKTCLQLGYPDWHAAMHDREIDEVVATRRPIRSEVPFTGTYGERIYDYIFVPVLDAAGAVVAVAGTTRDVTERKRAAEEMSKAREQAEVASRAKDNFLAALSHELRTPLTPVLMTAAALRDDARLPDDVRTDVVMIERNIALEARLIDDLLDLTRIAKGKLQLREENCDAHTLIGLAVEIVRDEAQSKPVALKIELAARRSGLRGDPARLQQVFWNLLRNSIKFTPVGGQITIRTRDGADSRLSIEVSDTGIGIDPSALESVFHPFEQAAREGDHRFGGLGLGLTIARAIVDLHGGAIRAHSEGAGKGATFTVELPGAVEQPTGATDTASGAVVLPPQGLGAAEPSLRLLLVEDHEPTLTVLARLLTRAGHQVVTAGTVAAALAAASAETFDLVVSDLGLPDGTGFEGMTKLRLLQPHLSGIALSGYGMDYDLQRSRDSGFATHLIKPVDIDQLRRAVREVAGLSKP